MGDYYLAVDIGASGGRHILGLREDGRLMTEEVYRFENGMENQDGTLCWDTDRLFFSILEGCAAAERLEKSGVCGDRYLGRGLRSAG